MKGDLRIRSQVYLYRPLLPLVEIGGLGGIPTRDSATSSKGEN